MPVSTLEILQLISDLGEEEGIKVSVTESLKGGLLTGAIAFVGGLLMGPIGLATGGVFGGVTSYFLSKGKFQSVGSVIMTMEPAKKELLANRVRNILDELDYTDLIQITIITAQPQLKQRLVQEVINFFQTQLKMETIC